MKKVFLFLIVFSFLSCKKETKQIKTNLKKTVSQSDIWEKYSFEHQAKILKDKTLKNTVLSNDIQFINDSILKGKFKLDISKYELNAKKKHCYPIQLQKKELYEFYDIVFNNLGDLNGDGKEDSVFVLHALNECDAGDSFYFTDNKIPRIKTDSDCCHPGDIVNIGDIDEDGKNEIAEYSSSCVSRYKEFNIYTFKNSTWKKITTFSFVINDQFPPDQDFKKLFRKTSKNHLEYFEISDIDINEKLIASWKKIKI